MIHCINLFSINIIRLFSTNVNNRRADFDEKWEYKRCYKTLRFHYFDESEHLVRPFIRIMLIFVLERMVGVEIFAPELIDLKAALVNVKMNVTLLKIRRAGLPNLGFWM